MRFRSVGAVRLAPARMPIAQDPPRRQVDSASMVSRFLTHLYDEVTLLF